MTEVLQSPSSSSSSSSLQSFQESQEAFDDEQEEAEEERVSNALIEEIKRRDKDDEQLSLLALLVTLIRKSSFWVSRRNDSSGSSGSGMDIGWPTNVQHVAHVTFDRFNGFLGLPVEFELEVPLRAPSARYKSSLLIMYVCVCVFLCVEFIWCMIELYPRF